MFRETRMFYPTDEDDKDEEARKWQDEIHALAGIVLMALIIASH